MKFFKVTFRTILKKLSLAITITIFLMAFFPPASHAIKSPDVTLKLNDLINQAEATYLKPMGMDFDTALNQHPDALSVAMGLALQKQMQYVDQGLISVHPYSQLRRQATEYLQEVAQRHNYRHPINGTAMGKDRMEDLLMENAAGFYNDTFIKKYGIDPSTVDLPMIIGDKPVQNNVQDLAAFIQADDDSEPQNNITLFGGEIASAEKPVVHTEVGGADIASFNRKGLICPEKCPPYQSGSYDWSNPTSFMMSKNSPVQCTYYDDGRIRSQSTHEQQGANFWFSIENGIYYLYSRTEGYKSKDFRTSRNGWEEVAAFSPQKKPYIYSRTQYKKGIKHGLDHFYRILPSGKPYLSSTMTYNNGKMHGPMTVFSFLPSSDKTYLQTKVIYRNGKRIKETQYNPDKTPKKEILYKPDGNTIDREINFPQ